jgi:hypothetical protein
MRATVLQQIGRPLLLTELPDPEPGAHEIRVGNGGYATHVIADARETGARSSSYSLDGEREVRARPQVRVSLEKQ